MGLILILPILILMSSVIGSFVTSDDYTGQTTAIVTAVEVREEYDVTMETRDDWYHLTAEYQVDGQTYTYTDKRLARASVGDRIDLRYVPSNPTRVRTAADHRVASNPASLALGLPIMLAMLLGVVWLIRSNLKRMK